MVEVQLLIGDHDRPATGAATFSRLNPVSGEEASRAAAATVADAVAAADAAAEAFPLWSRLGPNERRTRLLRAADLLQSRSMEFVSLMTAENGATTEWGQFNVHLAAQMLREAAEKFALGHDFLADHEKRHDAHPEQIHHAHHE